MISRLDICDCDCHDNDCIKHIAPCCYECLYCYNNIITYVYEKHLKECKKEYEKDNR